MDHQEKLQNIIDTLDSILLMKTCLNYGEFVLAIETCFPFDFRIYFDCIIYDLARGADALNRIKDLLVYLRDVRNDELKNMYSKESPITAPILYNLLNSTLKIRKIVQYFIKTCKRSENNPNYNACSIYPYLCSLDDVVEVIVYRHLKLFLHKSKSTQGMKNYLAYIPKGDLRYMSIKGCKTKNFNITLQEKLGVDLEVSHLLKPDSECPICGKSLDSNSDFAVLDTCNHLMCTDCAEVILMGQVVDLIPLYGESNDDVDVDYGHIVKLGKVPKCPCCRREVSQWTTTHIMKFCEEDEFTFWDVNTKDLLLRECILLADIFPNCVDECLKIDYSSTFVWMTVLKNVEILSYSTIIHQDNFSFVVRTIQKLLELRRAEESSGKYDFEGIIMSHVESFINRMVLDKKIENNSFNQQLLADITSNV